MEPNTRYTLVAVVVLTLISLVALFILWLSGFMKTSDTRLYTIYFREHSLSGLQVDSNVTMRGIKVGKVEDFQISPENMEDVKVLIKVDIDTPIKKDSEAIVSRNMLTGLANIEIVNSSQQSERLAEIREGELYPVIKEGKAPLEKLATSASSVVENANNTLARLNAFLSDDNVESFSGLLENLEKASGSFSSGTGNIEKLIAKMDGLFNNLTSLSKTLEKESSEVGTTVRESATQLNIQLANLSRELSVAARAISQTAERFDNPRSIIFGPSDNELGPGETRKR